MSKLSEHQEVTDIIWYDVLFIDNLGSNTPWEKVGQTVGQFLVGQKHLHYFITCEVSGKYFTTNKSRSNLNACTLAYKCKSHIYSILRNYIIVTLVISHT